MHGVDDDVEFKRMVELICIDIDDERTREVRGHSLQIGGVSDLIGKSGIIERGSNNGIDDGLWF